MLLKRIDINKKIKGIKSFQSLQIEYGDNEQFVEIQYDPIAVKFYVASRVNTKIVQVKSYVSMIVAVERYNNIVKNFLKELKTEFDIRDALGGEINCDFKKDLKRLMYIGYTCTEQLYNEACSNQSQP